VWRGSGAEDSGTGGVDIIGTARDGAVVGQKGKDSEVYEGGGLTMTARRRELLQEEERGVPPHPGEILRPVLGRSLSLTWRGTIASGFIVAVSSADCDARMAGPMLGPSVDLSVAAAFIKKARLIYLTQKKCNSFLSFFIFCCLVK
jgi:hypothetical protein